ncbi:hypothetical protein VTK56DRAFT_2717 [Thermocarpiscus australiensis]
MSSDNGPLGNLNGEGPPSSPHSRHPSISLQAAATLNAGLQRDSPSRHSSNSPLSRHQSPSTGRRRSQVLMNLQIADPSAPAPGEMVSDSQNSSFQTSSPHPVSASPRLMAFREPYHNRAPSLGELHQELENEQEFQVNRLLAEIRRLQEQLQRQQQGQPAAAGEEPSDRAVPIPISASSSHTSHPAGASSPSLSRSPGFPYYPRSSLDRRSRTPSRGASPRLRSTSISGDSDHWVLGGRDESAFYQAETQMLVRENQMLRHRIRELERQLSELNGSNTSLTHEPSQSSNLNRSVSASEDDSAKEASAAAQSPRGKAD